MISEINCNGHLTDVTYPKVMAVLNLTPDSFYDGNKNSNIVQIEQKINQYIEEGAAIIDIGAISTRPGAASVSEKEEWDRLLPALNLIKKYSSTVLFSLDTYRSQIVTKAVNDFNISIINDISAGIFDLEMFPIIAELKVPYILMHMQGTPQTMQNNPSYSNITAEICTFFSRQIQKLKMYGITDILIDPGFGFGKTIEQNFELLSNLNAFKIFNYPILVGTSRKAMIYKPLNTTPEFALNGTTVVNTISLMNGANILRVHDVKEAMEAIAIYSKLELG